MQPYNETEYLKKAKMVLSAHREELLALPGCTGVGIGLQRAKGAPTGKLSIVVFVREKQSTVPSIELVAQEIDGIATDVVERPLLEFDAITTDPLARHDPIFCGLSIAPHEIPGSLGSIGCFIRTPGDLPNHIPAGDYLLTCQHVLARAAGDDKAIIQPRFYEPGEPPPDYHCGTYVAGYKDPSFDCAIASVQNRHFQNEVPNYPWWPGKRKIKGVAVAVPGRAVYKFGANTRFTEGLVLLVHYSTPDGLYLNTTLIESKKGPNDVWVAAGDSGSVTLLQDTDGIIGLNFLGVKNSEMHDPPRDLPAYPAYSQGLAYDIQEQMNRFSSTGMGVTLS